ncbi:methionyl-tRNA formyltransferase [Candidatus Microgenomates bacterium]|nr:methionyl-tRNA formyltransferase [Candidatus Microgenomates bacterium]
MFPIIFFGTPDFSAKVLEKLISAKGYPVVAVVTAPDRKAGRHEILTPTPVKLLAQKNGIPVLTPEKLDEQFIRNSIICNSQLAILAAYGKIIPQNLLNLPKYGFLNIHPSLLPKYRGPSPVQTAILDGTRETGVTIMKMDEQVDHGPIIAQYKEGLKPDDTSETLLNRLFSKGADFLIDILPNYLEGRIQPQPQDHNRATFTKMFKREDGHIDLANPPSPEMFDRMIHAYYPWPGVWTKLGIRNQELRISNKFIKFLPGKMIQIEGGKPMTVKDFLNGYPEAQDWLSKIYQL